MLFIMATGMVAGGVFFLKFIISQPISMIEKGIGYAAVFGLFAIAGVIFYILSLGMSKKKINFFLYDRKTKKEIPLEGLTFEIIIKKLDLYLGVILSHQSTAIDAWISRLVPVDVPPVFRPLIPLGVLYHLIEANQDHIWQSLGTCSKEDADQVENMMHFCGANEIARQIQYLRATYDGDPAQIRDYFLGQKQAVQELIVDYVRKNIDLF